jgi:hypothetical protein
LNILRGLSPQTLQQSDLYKQGHLYVHPDFHSQFMGENPEEFIASLTEIKAKTLAFLASSQYLIITWGTAFYYEDQVLGRAIANCHKQAASRFIKKQSTVDEICLAYKNFILKNPHLKIIISVSPVRHTRDGMPENAVSKATLRLAADLLASIGAFLLPTRDGKLGLYRFELPSGSPVMTITAAHMAKNFSLKMVSRVKPKGGVAVNYCKNWTVQTGLKTNIPEECKTLLAQEWRVVRATSSAVASAYQDHTTPDPRDTYLIDEAQAQLVANYRLSIESRLRTTYEFEGLAPCLALNKGDEILVVHDRFNMQAGVSAIVTELQRNPFNRTVKVQFTVFEEVVSGITAGGSVSAANNKINAILDATSPRILGSPTGTFSAGALTVVENGAMRDITLNFDYTQGDVNATQLLLIAKGSLTAVPAAPTMLTPDVITQPVSSDAKSFTWFGVHPSIYWRVSIVARQQINGIWYNSAVTSPAGWTVTGTNAVVSGTFKRDFLITLVFDTLSAGQVFTLPPWPFAAKFFAGLPDSNFKAGVAATATTVITIKNNTTSIGTLTFAAGGTVPSVTFSADYQSAVDDELSFHFPAVADATLAKFRINMVGWR